MKKKILLLTILSITLFCCKKEIQATQESETQNQAAYLAENKFNITKGKLKELTAQQINIVQDWIEFNSLYENMKILNSGTRFSVTEDLTQVAAAVQSIEKNKFPPKLHATQIKSRFLVLKTKALKLRDDATDKSTTNDYVEKEIIEMNAVFDAILYQIIQASDEAISVAEIMGNTLPGEEKKQQSKNGKRKRLTNSNNKSQKKKSNKKLKLQSKN